MNKDKNNSDDRYFRTQNFYSACFLLARGFELVNIDKTVDPKRAYFVFCNSPELELQLHLFNFAKDNSSELLINARTIFTAIKQLKNALYQNIF